MPLITLQLPAGMVKNGTPYMAKNRWVGGSRVRWHDGSLRPIGGWRRRVDVLGNELPPIVGDTEAETIRDAKMWRDNTGTAVQLLFSNLGVYSVLSDGTITDVTPASFDGGINQPTLNIGYGSREYGRFEYGVARPSDGLIPTPVYRWSHSLWGQDVLACPASPTVGGYLYSYDTDTNSELAIVPNAPTDVNGVLVTDERIVMCIGSNSEPRTVRWSDRENREEWTPEVDNYAGFTHLTGEGRLISISSVLNTILILSESDAHVGRFIGAPYVYGFDRVADNCPPITASSVVVTERFAMWPSVRGFFMYDGTVRSVHCDVMDFLSADFQDAAASKLFGVNIAEYNEMWWFYQSSGATEVDSYVMFDYLDNTWAVGKLDRTAAYGSTGALDLLMIDHDSHIYTHEVNGVKVGDSYAITGPLELGQGDKNMAVRYIFPDTQTFGEVYYTLYGRQMPTMPDVTFGPYAYSNPISTRAMGRELRMQINGDDVNWEVGALTRFDVAPTGTGMR